ncbi:MAG: response regulator [Burkholderiaceae bacterium]
MAERILVVDDDADIRELLDSYLSNYGFEIRGVADGRAMRSELAAWPADLILLDLGLPGEDGLTLARELRGSSRAGIIIVTGRGQPVDRVVGLELGADDYVAKPFDLRELLARIRSVLRRIKPERDNGEPRAETASAAPAAPAATPAPERYSFDGWRLDVGARSLHRPTGEPVALTSGEFQLLMIFVQQPNQVLSRDRLMELIHGRESGPFDRAIDVQVGRLRRKIETDPAEPALIKSVRGLGYLFTPRVLRLRDEA